MSIERKKDEKGNLIFGVGNRDFSNQGEAEIKNNELEDKKKKAEKTDLMKEVARLPKKDDKKNKTEVKERS